MDSAEHSPQHEQARQRFERAQHELQHGHLDRAAELAQEALEYDGAFQEVRLWLVELHVRQGQPQRASRLLQDVLYADRHNEAAWQRLRHIDPPAAARLERLAHIAPDPFVGQRASSAFSAELDSMGGDAPPEEPEAADDDYEKGPGEVLEDPGADPPSPTVVLWRRDERGPAPWEYEQDREYLAKWQAEAIVTRMAAALRRFWGNYEAMRPILNLGAHLETRRHPEIAAGARQCCERLGLEGVEIMVVPERCMHPVPVQDDPPRVGIPTAMMRAMQGPEMVFQIGRELEYVRAGYLAEWQVATLLAQRPSRLAGDVAVALRDLCGELLSDLEREIPKEERPRLAKLAHAWQQRASLTADHAGFLCCGDAEAACRAIAKTTAPSVEHAARLTLAGFLEQFQGQDPAALAAIPVTETPDRSVAYAAYRIMMLRWWAKTPPAAELLRQMTS